MSKSVVIPSYQKPMWTCTIGDKHYSYTAGATVTVPDEVASVIDNYYAMLPQETVKPGTNGQVLTRDTSEQSGANWKDIPASESKLYAHNFSLTIDANGNSVDFTIQNTTATPILSGTTILNKLESLSHYVSNGGRYYLGRCRYNGDEFACTVYKNGDGLQFGGIEGALENTLYVYPDSDFDMYGSISEAVKEV